MPEFTKGNAIPQATYLNKSTTQNLDVANLVARITELEQKLADQAATTARISQLEQKLAQHQQSAATPAPQAGNSFRTSRRKLLKGMGVAAAGLAASATAFASQGSQQANAASGDYLILGNSNLASDATYLSQTGSNSGDGAILWADWNSNDKSAAPNVEAGLAGTSSTGIGGYFQGGKAPILLKPAASGTGAPASGNHSKGELYVDSAGDLFLCQSSGTPGDWVKVNGGTLTLAGDIGGTTSTPKIVGLQGTAVSNTAPANGQVLTYDGTNWTPGTGIPLAGDIGGTSTTPKVVGLQGQSVSTSNPSSGQVLTFNGTSWSPATPGSGSSGSYINLQSTTPGTADTGNLNVSGTVRAGGSGGIGGYFSGTTAPILLNPSASSGAPTSGSHSKGELYVDSIGDLYICQSSGSPGTWVKVNDSSGGGGGVSSVAVTAPITNSGTSTAPNIGLNITTDNDGGAIVK